MSNGVWFIRIIDGVRHSFPDRKIEWILGVWAFVWSVKWLLDPVDNFSTATGAWNGLRYLFEYDWLFAGLMCLTGVARLAALTINGTFKETLYARYSPLVRAITGVLCGLFWLAIWLSALSSGGQGSVTFWAPMVIEFLTAVFIVDESADVLREWRNGGIGRDAGKS